jgi:hypothetical protein
MKKFILKSPKFEGQVTFGYDVNGDLVFYHNEIPDQKVIKWINKYTPLNGADLEAFKQRVQATITEVPEDLSWDRFWNAYDKKINKKRVLPLFEKLSDADKMLAIMRIPAYKDYCYRTKRGVADPQKWLDVLFETDWNSLKY